MTEKLTKQTRGVANPPSAHFHGGPGQPVTLHRYIAQCDPKELDTQTGRPEPLELTWDEWQTRHAEFGLTLTGDVDDGTKS